MKGLEGLLSEPMMAAAGWTLLHFLWQGALVAALVAVARSALRNTSAQSRYLVGCAAMLALLVLPRPTTGRPKGSATVNVTTGGLAIVMPVTVTVELKKP